MAFMQYEAMLKEFAGVTAALDEVMREYTAITTNIKDAQEKSAATDIPDLEEQRTDKKELMRLLESSKDSIIELEGHIANLEEENRQLKIRLRY